MYVPQAVKKLLILSRLVSNGSTMGDTKDKMTTKKNVFIMILEARKVNNTSMIFYLKTEIYVPEVQVAPTNLPE